MRATLLLAAGGSRRFGAANKLMSRRGRAPLVLHALTAARAAPAGRLIVVTGAQGARVARAIWGVRGVRATIVRARRHREGLAASLRAGLAALRPCERQVFVFLGDMPAVPPHLAARLARTLVPGVAAVRPAHRGRPGHPVLLRRPASGALARLSGDRGLGPLLGDVRMVTAGAGALLDVDTPRTRWGSASLSAKPERWQELA